MRHMTFLATTAVAALIGSTAIASTVIIEQIGAIWANPMGDPDVTFTTDNGDGFASTGNETVSIFWGNPAVVGGGQSGYEFNPSDVPFLANPNEATSLGRFTHFNEPIFNPPGSLSSVDLQLVFGGTPTELVGLVIPPAVSFGTTFFFDHDETTNTGDITTCAAQVSGTDCDDVVTVSADGGPDQVVDVGNVRYTFSLLGFSTDNGVTIGSQFFTEEGEINFADLYFEYTVTPIPLPAAGFLLLGGLGALGALGRRRKAKAA